MPPVSLRCRECSTEYPLEARYVCEQCFGPLAVAYARQAQSSDRAGVDELRRRIQAGPYSMWRYCDFLPVAPPASALQAGFTPLLRADRLAEQLGIRELWIKNDAANPTHSFKDRVVSVALARARELGFTTIACASTGNLANAVAAHTAAVGLESYVFIPSDLEEQKILATGVYGTHLVAVRGNYDDVNRLCTELSAEQQDDADAAQSGEAGGPAGDRSEWAFLNINMRPYYAEGSKTLAFEIAEQLGFQLPDRVVVPIASGSLFTKLAAGFDEWIEAGLLSGETPTFNGAQADGCSPVATAFHDGRDFCQPVKPDTIAKSLAIGNPADGPYALDLARRTGGSIDSVPDDEIRDGIRLLATTTGIFTETAGGVTIAVLRKLAERGDIDPGERVVAVVTGEGLKTLECARGTFDTWEIEPSMDAFEAARARLTVAA